MSNFLYKKGFAFRILCLREKNRFSYQATTKANNYKAALKELACPVCKTTNIIILAGGEKHE